MFQAVIFDMDGVLVDTEPIWQEVEMLAFRKAGILLNHDLVQETLGLSTDDSIEYWYKKFPHASLPKRELKQIGLDMVREIMSNKVELKPGVMRALDICKRHKLKIALASSTPIDIIGLVLNKCKIKGFFDVIHSAETEKFAKPHPAVYITTVEKLKMSPLDCIAIEDTVTGIIAAKAARLKCIAIPDKTLIDDRRLGIADLVLSSMKEFNDNVLNKIQS